jgi:CRP-like cAMP-binding protein
LIGLIIGIFVFNHFLACIWWAVAKESIEDTRLENDSSSSYFTAYSQSVLLMMGERLDLTTNTAKIFSFVIIIFTSIFVAVLFGEVAMLVTSFNANSQKYQTKMTELYEAMDTMGLPVTLQERVLQFYDFLWLKHHSLDGKTAMASFFDELSPNLSKEIHMCMYKEMLLNVGFFREFTADVIHHLVMSLDTKIFMPRDYVISVGECGTDMFFIDYGKAEVFLKHTHVKTLKKNDYFGEIALITDVRRTASVQASTFLQVVCLEREDFEACAEDMTVDGRKRVLAHILKQYYGKDILQRCSEPDFVYENSESQEADVDDETMDMFNDEFDALHPHIAAEEEEIADIMETDLATIQRIELVENQVENINTKLDKLVNMNIKFMASADMWKARGAHDEATKGLSVKKELNGASGKILKGESSGSELSVKEEVAPCTKTVTLQRTRLQTAPEKGGVDGDSDSEGSPSPDTRMLRRTVAGSGNTN